MKSKQTGSLVWHKSGWYGRYWRTVDGVRKRVFVDLETRNEILARQRLDTFVAVEEGRTLPAKDVLYAIEFAGFAVKYGFSSNPEKRLARHRADAERFGRVVGRVWTSPPHHDARSNESVMKERYGCVEYLHGADFDVVVAELSELVQAGIARAA